jgi:hypothetical protein
MSMGSNSIGDLPNHNVWCALHTSGPRCNCDWFEKQARPRCDCGYLENTLNPVKLSQHAITLAHARMHLLTYLHDMLCLLGTVELR